MTPEFQERILREIKETVKVTVNGKIDKIQYSLDELKTDFKTHADIVQPIIEQFNDRKGFWNIMSSSSKNVGMVAALIVGGGLIISYLMKLYAQ
jgi:hypothetical protein